MAGIYIHIPFCKQACYYCDFHFSTSLKKKDEMLSAIKTELYLRRNEFNYEQVETIYFGGGTPSLLTNNELQVLIDEIYKNYKVIKQPEITLEANPDDLLNTRIHELSQTPINRLSIGIQSFYDDDLKAMNRAHDAIEAKQCLKEATKYFNNITIDLIYGIPNMSLSKWNENLQMAFELNIPHISSYALTVEPNTALNSFINKGKYPPIDESLALQHFQHLVSESAKKGYVHYEISNFGKENYFSKHNTSYWLGEPYLGIGPSAHSYNGQQRSWNVANNSKYIKTLKTNVLPQEIEILTKDDQFNEYIMTGLRTIWGISLETIKSRFGEKYLHHIKTNTKKYLEEELLIKREDQIYASNNGKFLIDGIASNLFMI